MCLRSQNGALTVCDWFSRWYVAVVVEPNQVVQSTPIPSSMSNDGIFHEINHLFWGVFLWFSYGFRMVWGTPFKRLRRGRISRGSEGCAPGKIFELWVPPAAGARSVSGVEPRGCPVSMVMQVMHLGCYLLYSFFASTYGILWLLHS